MIWIGFQHLLYLFITYLWHFCFFCRKKLLYQSSIKPRVWKRYIDDVFSLWDVRKQDIDLFIEQANTFHPTIKFTAEISETEITFLDTVVYKGERFQNEAILDVKTHYKPTETFQYTHYSSCHPPGVKKGFIKGEAIRLLRTNSSERNFQEAMCNFKTRLEARGYPKSLIKKRYLRSRLPQGSRYLKNKPKKLGSCVL